MRCDNFLKCIDKTIFNWVVPENIHTYTTGGISEFPKGRGDYVDWNSEDMGGSLDWNSEGKGGSLDWNSEGMGGFSGQ